MDLLAQNPIQMLFHDITVTIPHPASFALQKLLIAGRRGLKDKAEKDRSQAVAILNALQASGEMEIARTLYTGHAKTPAKDHPAGTD